MNRAELIDRLRELADYAESREWDLPLDLADVLLEAAKALETPPWIPVAENEPPVGATVLIRVWDTESHLMKVSAGYRGLHHYWLAKDPYPVDLDRNIVHWMPLPEPPEMEAEG